MHDILNQNCYKFLHMNAAQKHAPKKTSISPLKVFRINLITKVFLLNFQQLFWPFLSHSLLGLCLSSAMNCERACTILQQTGSNRKFPADNRECLKTRNWKQFTKLAYGAYEQVKHFNNYLPCWIFIWLFRHLCYSSCDCIHISDIVLEQWRGSVLQVWHDPDDPWTVTRRCLWMKAKFGGMPIQIHCFFAADWLSNDCLHEIIWKNFALKSQVNCVS